MDNSVKRFIDKQGRTIIIGGDDKFIVAEHNGVEIGIFDFFEDEYTPILLTNCSINNDYQRGGIGTEMMKLAEEWYEDFDICNHLSEEGANFINFCTEGIFKKNHQLVYDNRF